MRTVTTSKVGCGDLARVAGGVFDIGYHSAVILHEIDDTPVVKNMQAGDRNGMREHYRFEVELLIRCAGSGVRHQVSGPPLAL